MSRISVTWQGRIVGHMADSRPDMWYLEGAWRPVPGSHTDTFLSRTSSLNARAVMFGSQRGLVVSLTEDTASGPSETMAIVMAPPTETLWVRRIVDAEAAILAKVWEAEQA
ncbi:MAG: hypothetical protein J0M24_26940 [Verrucomicrobia bacterium]|nr:hypothetical protein [Verrucomicrobiota bacterium]